MHFIHLNAQSMFLKMSELRILAKENKPAVLSITETWLNDSFTNESIKIEGYNIVRRDRIGRSAGGVLMYIREDLSFNPRTDLQNDNLEDIYVELLLNKTKPIITGTCYRAPDNVNFLECIENTLNKIDPDSETIFLGDFNINLLDESSSIKKPYLDILKINNYKHLINSPTRVTESSSTCIDHIFANKTERICQSGVIVSGLSDHYITYCTRKVYREQINKHNTVKIRSLKNYCNNTFIEKLRNLDWSIVLQCTDVNVAWNKFKIMFTQIINEIAPEKETRIKGRTEKWITSETLDLMHERDKMLMHANKNKDDIEARKRYKELRNRVIKVTRKAKSNYFSDRVEEFKDNAKLLWKQFKSLGYSHKTKEKSKIVLEIDNKKYFDPKEVVK